MELDRTEKAYKENEQVAQTFYVQDRIEAFLQQNRVAWKEFWEQEKLAKYEADAQWDEIE